MVPSQLKAEQFKNYPPEARLLATKQIALLQQLPMAFLPLLLRELITYDWKFPVERRDLDQQFAYLSSLTAAELHSAMAAFASLRISPELEQLDWINAPVQFSERFTAHLWATHQIDAFRTASVDYVHKLNSSIAEEKLPTRRLGIVVIGQGVSENNYSLFRRLRPYGVYFSNVSAEGGRKIFLEAAVERAAAHPIPFAHWYIDGAHNDTPCNGLTCVSYGALAATRSALIAKMRKVMQPGGGGPELLRTMLAQMRPEDLGMAATGDAGILNRFQVSLLTEGSGTQLFSTTFVQWSAREALRRAQPLTLVTCYAPRQREQSMRELLAGTQREPVPDPYGSLVDADMGAYYTWINQQRLSGASETSFLVWFEGHNEAVAVGPSLRRGTEDKSALGLRELLSRVVS